MEIQKKQYMYRGKTVEELKELEVREFAKYLPSRQKRTVLRNFQVIEEFVKQAKIKIEKGKKVRTHLRGIIIVPQMMGMTIFVYNGKNFNQIIIEPEMLGHRLGEMSLTRSRVAHSKAGVGATKGTKHKSKK